SRGSQPEPEHAARAGSQPIVRRLAIDQEPGAAWHSVRDRRAIAASLFTHDEQESDATLAARPQPFGCGDLSRQNPLRIAPPAAIKPAVFHATCEKRRDAVVM